MQEKYLEHYMAVAFDKWFKHIFSECGDTPIRAAVQNYLYVQDPTNPEKVRIQTFIHNLILTYEKLKRLPDPANPPKVFEAGVSIHQTQLLKPIGEILPHCETLFGPKPIKDLTNS